jgi:hypothetical protein
VHDDGTVILPADGDLGIDLQPARSLPFRLLMLVGSAALLPTGTASGQSHSDSVAVMRAIGGALRGEARQVLATIVCYPRRNPCPPARQDSTDLFMGELARAASAAVVKEGRESVPACPWGYDPPKANAGFRVGVSAIRFDVRGDTARVMVLQRCDNPPGYLHDIFARDFEYQLARRPGGEWHVIYRRLMRIT